MLSIARVNPSALEAFIKEYLFCGEFYKATQKDFESVPDKKLFKHFNEIGWKKGFSCHPLVELGRLSQYLEMIKGPENLTFCGALECIAREIPNFSLSFFFDGYFYASNNPDVTQAGKLPFVHWITFGIYEGRQSVQYLSPIKLGENNPLLLKSATSLGYVESLACQFPDIINKNFVDPEGEDEFLLEKYINSKLKWPVNPDQIFLSPSNLSNSEIKGFIELLKEGQQ